MSHDCGLERGDRVYNLRTHESGTFVSGDALTVHVIFPGGQQALWAHADVIWVAGALADAGRTTVSLTTFLGSIAFLGLGLWLGTGLLAFLVAACGR